jgi:cytosine/adenosine deaminase-related metal-dependent hydrolase
MEQDTIAAIEAHGRRRPDEDLGNVAILPGFVNAHTHLDLTGMRGLCPPTADFPAWLRAVVNHRRQRTVAQIDEDIRAGLAECQRYGTTLIGDIAGQGASWPMFEQASVRSVVFLELLGLPADRAQQAYQQAVTWLATHGDTDVRRAGLSPHAPYSVRAELFSKVAELLSQQCEKNRRVPSAIHLAESRQELELLERVWRAERLEGPDHDVNRPLTGLGSPWGPMADFLQDLGVWAPDGLVRSPGTIVQLFDKLPNVLFVHGNYLEPAGISPATLVYCPRTHAAFGHPPHPFREFLAKGVRVALGTDSLASNPDLDVLAEARFLHRQYPEVPGETLLEMLTINGAAALGWADVTGSLTVGKSADLAVLPLSAEEAADPHQLLFDSEQKVRRVMWRGTWGP